MHNSLCVNDLHSTGKMDKQALKPRISNDLVRQRCDEIAQKMAYRYL